MTRYSKSVLSYTDVHQAFEAAGNEGTLKLEFETPAEAVNWCGRANAYRVLLRQQNKDAGRDFACEFDHLVVSHKKGENTAILKPRGYRFKAFREDGSEVQLDKRTLSGPVLTPYQKTQAELEADAFLEEYEKEQKK